MLFYKTENAGRTLVSASLLLCSDFNGFFLLHDHQVVLHSAVVSFWFAIAALLVSATALNPSVAISPYRRAVQIRHHSIVTFLGSQPTQFLMLGMLNAEEFYTYLTRLREIFFLQEKSRKHLTSYLI